MSYPTISVVLPVYNGATHLVEAIDSVISQTFTDFEFIILNDGSTDSSSDIITKYADREPRIRFIERENKGLIKTLNEGIDIAMGKYIARMDQDDICLPLRFEKQVEYLDIHQYCLAVGVRSQLIDVDGDIICTFGSWTTHDEIDSAHIKGIGGAIVHPSAMIRREALLRIGGYSDKYPDAEDLDLWLRLAEEGELNNIPEELFQYRQHLNSIGYTKRLSQLESATNAVMAACERRNIKFDKTEMRSEASIMLDKHEIFTKWGWWALNSENVQTAKKYALKALINKPSSVRAWKLLACCIRGNRS